VRRLTLTGLVLLGLMSIDVGRVSPRGWFVAEAVVINPKGYAIPFSATALGFNPADVTTYYAGELHALTMQTTATVQAVRIPKAGVVTYVYATYRNFGTAGSTTNSTVSFRLNNTTDYTIATTVDTSVLATYVNAAPLNAAVARSDFFEIKWVTPTWATNPTNVTIAGVVYVDVP
jgi:hypothetical protein